LLAIFEALVGLVHSHLSVLLKKNLKLLICSLIPAAKYNEMIFAKTGDKNTTRRTKKNKPIQAP